MSHLSPHENTDAHPDAAMMETIVAYLDGELSPEEAAAVESRLAVDAAYREAVEKMRRAWSFLDDLQLESGSAEFTHSTVAMVAHDATQTIQRSGRMIHGWRPWLFAAITLGALTTTSYVVSASYLAQRDRQFLRDLPMIQRVDRYRNIDDLAFLRALSAEGLFGVDGIPDNRVGDIGEPDTLEQRRRQVESLGAEELYELKRKWQRLEHLPYPDQQRVR
ncbi:MAG: hypothetical protein KDB14_32620, partial [Planctomycetales bacterium]|nr:hypothetical protein [Planctomycetales bacterium]